MDNATGQDSNQLNRYVNTIIRKS